MKTYKYIDQSSWIQDYYNKLGFDTKTGFLLEIGVGNVIDYPGRDTGTPVTETFTRGSSNTSELIDMGWSGVYVEPVQEYLEQCKALFKDHLNRLVFLNYAASDVEEELIIKDNLSFLLNSTTQTAPYIGRKVQSINTNVILEMHCPRKINLLSLDVEGYEDKVLKPINFDKFQFHMIVVEINVIRPHIISSILPSYYSFQHHDGLNAVYINEQYESII